MATAIFEVKSIVQNWGPPFGKQSSSYEASVSVGQSFDSMPNEGPIFKLIKIQGNTAIIQFHEKFTLKGHLHPRNRQAEVGKEEAVSFTFLWGNDGMTKSLRLKEVVE